MKPTRIAIVGAGKRIVEDGLPVVVSLGESLQLVGVWSRTPRSVEAGGARYEVRALEDLESRGLDGIDLVWVVVAKTAVPGVLKRLARLDTRGCTLLVETPGLLYKHLSRRPLFDSWRATWVSEDCAYLPIFETLERFVATGKLGEQEHLLLDRSAYAYHGLAMVKRLLGPSAITSGSRKRIGGERFERRLGLRNGRRATITEPRDYASGRLVLRGERGSVSDADGTEHRLAPILANNRCTGFCIGDVRTDLVREESELLGPWGDAAGVVPRMHGLKRVGLRRLLDDLARGRGGYPLVEALDDMGVDYHLERLGRWLRNPLTGAHSRVPGRILRLLGR